MICIWLAMANILMASLFGFLLSEHLGGGLQVIFRRVVYDEPRTVVVGIQVRRGALA